MKLRIVAGTLKGRHLTLSDKWAKFRPTQERVRQALVEKIKQYIPGAIAADLCAGSGALGFELISRGAAAVHFVENDKMYCRKIVEHASGFAVEARCIVHSEDIRRFTARPGGAYDILFYDPPYEDAQLAGKAPGLLTLLAPEGVLIYEHDVEHAEALNVSWPEDADAQFLRETRRYGNTVVEFFFRR